MPEIATQQERKQQTKVTTAKVRLTERRVLAGKVRERGAVLAEITCTPGFDIASLQKVLAAGEIELSV